MTLTDVYNPDPDRPYARCKDCGEVFADRASAREHQEESMGPLSGPRAIRTSHTIRVTNLTRAERIDYAVDGVVYDALREHGDMCGRELEFNEDTDRFISREIADMIRGNDITRDEAEDALRRASANHIADELSEENTDA
ncbi:hypothetical protein ACT3SZ_15520 [Corynebacterium sp. AOP40-9SA-29]|uniref:hypothetical protein n=1 Tax=Corynebacterium sp. AOP40-9SA-29 TaxID=3457677 RepID=UPI0040343A27